MKRRMLKKMVAYIQRLEQENYVLRLYALRLENEVNYLKSKSP